ncbi:MAG: prenyltransferase, partial [Minisyncoccia bacterium]
MANIKHTEHTEEEIYSALLQADVSAVATHEGVNIKQRQMHFAPNKDLELYFATMKGDPKTVQITDDRCVSILVLNRSGEMNEWSETEFSGYMDIIKDEAEKRVALRAMYDRSPIVKNLTDAKMDHILELLVMRPLSVKYRIFGEIVQGFPPTIKTFGALRTKSIRADLDRSWKRLVIWYHATRSLFLVATIIPIVLGFVVAYTGGTQVSFVFVGLTLFAGISMHIGANLLNDYMDHIGGSDEANTDFTRPFTGGSRMIQLGLILPHVMLQTSLLFLGLGALVGLY